MAIYEDFSSLFQLGVGVGIGLSIFRAPVDLRIARLSRTMEAEIVAMRGDVTQFAKTKRRDMMDLRLRFAAKRDSLNKALSPFMIAAVFAAMLNLGGLIAVTLASDRVATCLEVAVFLFISVGWFLIELVALEILARVKLSSIIQDLERVRTRKAPPVQLLTANSAPCG